MDNLAIWAQVEKTDPKMTERVNFGAFKFTTIDAQYQIKRATEVFGPCGIGWGISDSKYTVLVIDPNDRNYSVLEYTATLWYIHGDKTGSFDISSDIDLFENTKNGWKKTKDPHKKVRTDALTKGLSWLGFSADVFLGKFDDAKYVSEVGREFEQKPAQAKPQQQQPQQPAQAKTEPETPIDPELKAALDRLKSLSQKVGMTGTNLHDYLKKHYLTTWNRLDAKTANMVADGIERSLAGAGV